MNTADRGLYRWQLGPVPFPVAVLRQPAVDGASLATVVLEPVEDWTSLTTADWSVSRQDSSWHWQTALSSGHWQPQVRSTGHGRGLVSANNWQYGALEATLATMWCEVVDRGGLVLHATTIERLGSDRCVVVAGRSGAGKTTLAHRFGPDWVNEEHAFLVPDERGWVAWYFRQYRGQRHRTTLVGRLHAVHVLGPNRSQTAVHPMARADAIGALLGNAYVPEGDGLAALATNAETLVATLPVFLLDHCLHTPLEQLADTLFEAK